MVLLLRLTQATLLPGTDRWVYRLSGDDGEVRVETNSPKWIEKVGPGGSFRVTIEAEATAETAI